MLSPHLSNAFYLFLIRMQGGQRSPGFKLTYGHLSHRLSVLMNRIFADLVLCHQHLAKSLTRGNTTALEKTLAKHNTVYSLSRLGVIVYL